MCQDAELWPDRMFKPASRGRHPRSTRRHRVAAVSVDLNTQRCAQRNDCLWRSRGARAACKTEFLTSLSGHVDSADREIGYDNNSLLTYGNGDSGTRCAASPLDFDLIIANDSAAKIHRDGYVSAGFRVILIWLCGICRATPDFGYIAVGESFELGVALEKREQLLIRPANVRAICAAQPEIPRGRCLAAQ